MKTKEKEEVVKVFLKYKLLDDRICESIVDYCRQSNFSDLFLDKIVRKFIDNWSIGWAQKTAALRKNKKALTPKEINKFVEIFIKNRRIDLVKEAAQLKPLKKLSQKEIDLLAETILADEPRSYASAMRSIDNRIECAKLKPSQKLLDRLFLSFVNAGNAYLPKIAEEGVSLSVINDAIKILILHGYKSLALELAQFRPNKKRI